jgi:hypothetical protein
MRAVARSRVAEIKLSENVEAELRAWAEKKLPGELLRLVR